VVWDGVTDVWSGKVQWKPFNVITDNVFIWFMWSTHQSPKSIFTYSVESTIVITRLMLSDWHCHIKRLPLYFRLIANTLLTPIAYWTTSDAEAPTRRSSSGFIRRKTNRGRSRRIFTGEASFLYQNLRKGWYSKLKFFLVRNVNSWSFTY
jgi:hypothetical protein